MEQPYMYYDSATFIETKKNTKLSKRGNLKGTQNIKMNSKNIVYPCCNINGTLGKIVIGSNNI